MLGKRVSLRNELGGSDRAARAAHGSEHGERIADHGMAPVLVPGLVPAGEARGARV
jgi:hypothetical protein